MNRRTWIITQGSGFLAIFLAGATSVFVSGCNVIASIKAYVPVGIAAFSGIVSLLSSVGIIPPGTGTAVALLVALVKAGFADLMAAIDDYQNAPAAEKTGLLAKVSLVLSEISQNIGKFLSDVTINDSKLLTLVTGLADLILSTLAGFAAQLPPAPVPVALKATIAGNSITLTPKILSKAAFKKRYNELAAQGGHGEIALK